MIARWTTHCGFAAVVLMMTLTAGLRADHLRNVEPGKPLPVFSADTLAGKRIESKDLKGKAVVLVYLSARQRQSEEALASAHKIVANIGNPDLKLVYMSADVKEADYFRRLRDQHKAHEPFGLDVNRRHYGDLGLIVLPTTVIRAKDGKLLHVVASMSRGYEHELGALCRHALGEIDDAELAKRLAAKPEVRNEARAKAERHRSMAAILRKKGMSKSAIQELEQAVAADPDYADAVADLAELLVAENRLDDAEKRINDLLAKRPRFHRAKLTLGLIKLKRGKLDEAEKLLNEALVMNPDPVRAHYYLGQLHEKKNDYKLAMEHYRDALKRCLNER